VQEGMGRCMDAGAADKYQIAARMERLPLSRWHNKMRLIVGSTNFSDAFDALTIAYVLPALIPMWHLAPSEIGALISIGYLGQAAGGLMSGWFADRYGRVPVMVGNIILFSLMSFACALANDYWTLFGMRFVQGIGLGGEVPIANTYVSEFGKSKGRGRFVLMQQIMFPIGLTTAGLVGYFAVPHLGWRWMFLLGGLPVLLAIPMIRALPESPRWLASRGRDDEADRIMTHVEALVTRNGAIPLPPMPTGVTPVAPAHGRFRDLFSHFYLKRTLSL
jgi:putative MFS transporter